MTSWFRRFLAGALRHQHTPLPTEDHDDDDALRRAQEPPATWANDSPYSTHSSAGPRRGEHPNYHSAIEPLAPNFGSHPNREIEDEQAQIDLAIRNSLQEETLRQDISNDDYQLRLAIEISKKEAEQAGIVLPQEKSKPAQLPDLLSFDDYPAVPSISVPTSSSVPPTSHPNPLSRSLSEEMKMKQEQLSLDEALARSLQEEFDTMNMNDSVGNRNRGNSSNSHNGGDLTFSNQRSYPNSTLNQNPSNHQAPPLYPPNNFQFVRNALPNCAGCNRPLNPFKFLSCLGKNWHETCFLCQACNKPINEPQFKVEGELAYHSLCHKKLFHPICAVCKNYITASSDGTIRMTSFPPWKEKYCPAHVSDGTARCTGCKRLEPRGNEFVDLEDGRKLCLQCMDSSLFTTEECIPLFADIHAFFRSLGLHIRQNIPLLCVETQALNSAMERESSHHHQVETRGVCLTEERTISTVVGRRNVLGRISVKQNPVFVQRQAKVTAILVLYALPKLTTGSILAHELMHAWIKLDGGFPPLSAEIEEGICQVMSLLWLQYNRGAIDFQISSSNQSQKSEMAVYQKSLMDYEISIIKEDSSVVYGDGFRAVYAAVQKYGLKSTLDHIRLTSSLP